MMQVIENKQDLEMEQLQAELERQYGPAAAQGIIDNLRRNEDKKRAATPDYMDVKAMSELQERFRAQAMQAVWRLKEWRKSQMPMMRHENLIQLEGAFLERQCADSYKLYRFATQNYHEMYRTAMVAFSVPVTYSQMRMNSAA